MERAGGASAILFFLVAASCWHADPNPSDSSASLNQWDQREIVVTRGGEGFPSSCTPAAVADVILRFTIAITEGDDTSLQALLAPKPAFKWYSVTEGRRNFVAYDQQDLLLYLEMRHQHAERIVPLMLDVAFDRAGSLAEISLVLRRFADDLEPRLGGREHIAEGKAAIDCLGQQVVVWSIGMDRVPFGKKVKVNWPCTRPSGWNPDTQLIACAR
jgi:hypothetical protein